MAKQISDTYTISLKGQPGAYTVEADSPGEIRVEPQTFAWSPGAEQSATLAALREEGPVAAGALRELGQALHRALFVPAIAEAWGRAQARAEGVRLRLAVEPPELAALPWEALHDGTGYLSARSERPLVRALPGGEDARWGKRLAVRGALRVLFVGASPEGLPALDQERAAAEVRARLAEAVAKKRVVLDVLLDATLAELRSKLLGDYHVVYLMGHGTEGAIYLDDGQGGERDALTGRRPAGDADEVTAGELAAELEGKATRLVYVGACETGVATGFAVELARLGGLPAVVGMQYRIGDGAAGKVAGRFFESLGAMYAVDVALAEARKALLGDGGGGRDAMAPVLYLQAEDGALFRRARNWPAIGLLITLAVVALVLGSLSLSQARQTRIAESTAQAEATGRAIARIEQATAQAQAEARRRESRARELAEASRVALDTYPQRSLLLAVEALQVTQQAGDPRVPAAEEALRQVLARSGGLGLGGHSGFVEDVELSPEGRWLITAGGEGTARLWSLVAADPVAAPVVLDGHEGPVTLAAFSADGRWVATAGADGTARLWELPALSGAGAADPSAAAAVLGGHSRAVTVLAFSPDGRWLVTGDEGGILRLWDPAAADPASGSVVLSGLEGPVSAVVAGPDGRWLVAVGSDSTILLWDLADPGLPAGPIALHRPEGVPGADVGPAMAFVVLPAQQSAVASADGRWLAVADEDLIRLWDIPGLLDADAASLDLAAKPTVLSGPVAAVSTVAISPDSHWLVSGGWDNTAYVWDLAAVDPAAMPVAALGHAAPVSVLAISAYDWLFTGSNDGMIYLWNLNDPDPAATAYPLPGHQGPITALAVSPDHRWLVSGSNDATARLWDLATRDPAASSLTLVGHENVLLDVAVSADSRWLATRSSDGTARLWDLAEPRPAAAPLILDERYGALVPSGPTGSRWLVTAGGGYTYLWDLTAADLETPSVVVSGQADGVAAVSADERWLAAAGGDETVLLWDISAVLGAGAAGWGAPVTPTVLSGHEDAVEVVAISLDSHWLVTGSRDQDARLWDLTAPDPPSASLVLPGHEDNIAVAAFSDDGRWLVTASWDDTARLWDLAARDPAVTATVLGGAEFPVAGAAFGPDSHWLAVGEEDVWLLDLTAESPKSDPMEIAGLGTPVTFSPDGRWLVALRHFDQDIRLLDMADPAGEPLVLRGHDAKVSSIAVSDDGHWLATGSWDDTARLWDLTAADPAATSVLLPHEEAWLPHVVAVALGPDAHWLATAVEGGTVRLWTLRLDDLMDLACRTAGRNLTRAEWEQTFGDEPYRKTCPELPMLEE
jgi:WD40 repeat protein